VRPMAATTDDRARGRFPGGLRVFRMAGTVRGRLRALEEKGQGGLPTISLTERTLLFAPVEGNNFATGRIVHLMPKRGAGGGGWGSPGGNEAGRPFEGIGKARRPFLRGGIRLLSRIIFFCVGFCAGERGGGTRIAVSHSSRRFRNLRWMASRFGWWADGGGVGRCLKTWRGRSFFAGGDDFAGRRSLEGRIFNGLGRNGGEAGAESGHSSLLLRRVVYWFYSTRSRRGGRFRAGRSASRV